MRSAPSTARDRAKFLVRGSEAADFLQGQVSNDVEALEPGQGCYATILNVKGKLRTDLRILRGKDIGAHPAEPGASAGWFFLDTEAIGHAVLRHMLETYSLGRDVQHEDLTSDARARLAARPRGARGARRGAARGGARVRPMASTASTCRPTSAST